MTKINQCADLLRTSRRMVVLTGAGVSTNAGIPDFRGPQGLYVTKHYDPDRIFDIHYFYQNQKPFFEFAKDFIALEKRITPTFTHRFLAYLEEIGHLSGVITQNIDFLHQRAGSKNVLELHGSFWTSYCLDCGKKFDYPEMQNFLLNDAIEIPLCGCGGVIKPDIVFFGENVKCLNKASTLAEQADLFFVIGSSCVVYPAAMIPTLTFAKTVVVNRDQLRIPIQRLALFVDNDCDEFFKEVAKELGYEIKPA